MGFYTRDRLFTRVAAPPGNAHGNFILSILEMDQSAIFLYAAYLHVSQENTRCESCMRSPIVPDVRDPDPPTLGFGFCASSFLIRKEGEISEDRRSCFVVRSLPTAGFTIRPASMLVSVSVQHNVAVIGLGDPKDQASSQRPQP